MPHEKDDGIAVGLRAPGKFLSGKALDSVLDISCVFPEGINYYVICFHKNNLPPILNHLEVILAIIACDVNGHGLEKCINLTLKPG
jgi:hypothetical protein